MREEIHLLLGHEPRVIAGVAPTTTVLEWLRTREYACGTKEGCAEGDCGACTVALGEPDGVGGVRYRPVNACILLVPALDGRQLLTVEHMRAADGALHPVQRALVERHGSQCGFCTPGFVMSLFAQYHSGRGAARGEINEALAGNLCRCTGYRPIADAAADSCAAPAGDQFSATAAATAARLAALPATPLDIGHAEGRYLAPRTLAELGALYAAHPTATLVAGATDVGLWVTKERRAMPLVIGLDRVAGLSDIAVTDTALRIGAGALYEDALAILAADWPELGVMLRRLGSRQIRNRGTIGGNLGTASPIGDMAPALLALDATLTLRHGDTERALPLREFFLGYRRTALLPGEFIASIAVPRPAAGETLRVYKVSKRFEEDISAVCTAFWLRVEDGTVRDLRVAFGGMAATPLRVPGVEAALIGQSWTRETVARGMAAMDAALHPIGDMRASARYRSTVARNLLLRLWLETSGQPARTRLLDNAA